MRSFFTLFNSVVLIIAISGFSKFACAQCIYAIPSTAKPYFTDITTTGLPAPGWICPGVTVSSNGNLNSIYVEVGATYYGRNGIKNNVYVPKGAKVKFDVAASQNKIFFVDSADVISTGGGATLTQCTSIDFDYTNAPDPGCVQTTGLNGNGKLPLFSIYPKISSGKFTVSFNKTQRASKVRVSVFDILGKVIYSNDSADEQTEINLSSKPPGVYLAKIQIGNKEFNDRIIIQ